MGDILFAIFVADFSFPIKWCYKAITFYLAYCMFFVVNLFLSPETEI